MSSPQPIRHARLFRSGRNQAVRIPEGFELPGTEVSIRRQGEALVIEPLRKATLLEVLEALEPVDAEFPVIDDLPPEPVDDFD